MTVFAWLVWGLIDKKDLTTAHLIIWCDIVAVAHILDIAIIVRLLK